MVDQCQLYQSFYDEVNSEENKRIDYEFYKELEKWEKWKRQDRRERNRSKALKKDNINFIKWE